MNQPLLSVSPSDDFLGTYGAALASHNVSGRSPFGGTLSGWSGDGCEPFQSSATLAPHPPSMSWAHLSTPNTGFQSLHFDLGLHPAVHSVVPAGSHHVSPYTAPQSVPASPMVAQSTGLSSFSSTPTTPAPPSPMTRYAQQRTANFMREYWPLVDPTQIKREATTPAPLSPMTRYAQQRTVNLMREHLPLVEPAFSSAPTTPAPPSPMTRYAQQRTADLMREYLPPAEPAHIKMQSREASLDGGFVIPELVSRAAHMLLTPLVPSVSHNDRPVPFHQDAPSPFHEHTPSPLRKHVPLPFRDNAPLAMEQANVPLSRALYDSSPQIALEYPESVASVTSPPEQKLFVSLSELHSPMPHSSPRPLESPPYLELSSPHTESSPPQLDDSLRLPSLSIALESQDENNQLPPFAPSSMVPRMLRTTVDGTVASNNRFGTSMEATPASSAMAHRSDSFEEIKSSPIGTSNTTVANRNTSVSSDPIQGLSRDKRVTHGSTTEIQLVNPYHLSDSSGRGKKRTSAAHSVDKPSSAPSTRNQKRKLPSSDDNEGPSHKRITRRTESGSMSSLSSGSDDDDEDVYKEDDVTSDNDDDYTPTSRGRLRSGRKGTAKKIGSAAMTLQAMERDMRAKGHATPHSTVTSTVEKRVQNTKVSRGRKVPIAAPHVLADADRQFPCTVPGCGKLFVRNEHLKRHVRSLHCTEKPHKCPYAGCNRAFSRRDNLGQHVRIHL